jgi:hypothetical protein
MTLEQLLECDASKLEAMADADLLKYFAQYLDITRPERARTKQTKTQHHEPTPFMTPGKKKALNALEEMGIDMDLFRKNRRKK